MGYVKWYVLTLVSRYESGLDDFYLIRVYRLLPIYQLYQNELELEIGELPSL